MQALLLEDELIFLIFDAQSVREAFASAPRGLRARHHQPNDALARCCRCDSSAHRKNKLRSPCGGIRFLPPKSASAPNERTKSAECVREGESRGRAPRTGTAKAVSFRFRCIFSIAPFDSSSPQLSPAAAPLTHHHHKTTWHAEHRADASGARRVRTRRRTVPTLSWRRRSILLAVRLSRLRLQY